MFLSVSGNRKLCVTSSGLLLAKNSFEQKTLLALNRFDAPCFCTKKKGLQIHHTTRNYGKLTVFRTQNGSKMPRDCSVSRRGGCNKGGRKQTRANANKRRQTRRKRRGENAEAKTQANANKRVHPPLLPFLKPPFAIP